MINSKGIATVFIKRAHSDSYFYKFLFWKRHSRDQSPIFFVVVALRRLQPLENRRENRRPSSQDRLFVSFPGIRVLWDRILGYGPEKGLLLLPILAASIFIFRTRSLMGAANLQDVKDCLGDPSRIKVVPLLTFFFLQEVGEGHGRGESPGA
jgi:hypothetical protein